MSGRPSRSPLSVSELARLSPAANASITALLPCPVYLFKTVTLAIALAIATTATSMSAQAEVAVISEEVAVTTEEVAVTTEEVAKHHFLRPTF